MITTSTAAAASFYDPVPHVQRLQDGTLEFDAAAVEITILDGRGHAIWRARRTEGNTPILHWNGMDLYGRPVVPGTYTCKLHIEGQGVLYVPFVYMK